MPNLFPFFVKIKKSKCGLFKYASINLLTSVPYILLLNNNFIEVICFDISFRTKCFSSPLENISDSKLYIFVLLLFDISILFLRLMSSFLSSFISFSKLLIFEFFSFSSFNSFFISSFSFKILFIFSLSLISTLFNVIITLLLSKVKTLMHIFIVDSVAFTISILFED